MQRRRGYGWCVLLAATAAASAAKEDFSRYESILQRKPFGDVVAAAGAGAPGAAAAPSFVKDLKLCVITESTKGDPTVGVINNALKPPKSYLLRLGEAQDGLVLVDADIDREAALLRKGTEQEWLYLRAELAPGGAQAGAPSPATTVTGPPRIAPGANMPTSYAERLRRRREAIQEVKFEPPKLTGEELKEHLKQYQLELIRAGGQAGPPLPIPLTKEMDDQLVQEGVLPPADEAAAQPGVVVQTDEDEDEDEE